MGLHRGGRHGPGYCLGLDEGTITTVAGAVTSLISIITYVLAEGKIDAAAVNQAYVDIDTLVSQVKEALLSQEKVGGSE